INGNPLLRYDGYYVLADLAETPNLARQASEALRQTLAHVVLGIELPVAEEAPVGRRIALALFAVASTAYRWVVLFGVLLFIYKALVPQRIEVLAQGLVIAVAAGIVFVPLRQFVRFSTNPFWRRKVQSRRALAGVLAVAALAAGVLA